jgi:hypothetical protein
LQERERFEANLKEQEEALVKILAKEGISEPEAREAAHKQLWSMGSTKTIMGECPIGGLSPVSCMFCEFGHMTECHYPLDCEEAQCSHYQQGLEEV